MKAKGNKVTVTIKRTSNQVTTRALRVHTVIKESESVSQRSVGE